MIEKSPMQGSFDPVLVTAAVLVAVVAAYVVAGLTTRRTVTRARRSWVWPAIGCLALVAGIWTLRLLGIVALDAAVLLTLMLLVLAAAGTVIERELSARAALAEENARLYREAQEARAQAEEASRTKSEFLAVVSHELRTPLNAIVGFVDLLLAGVPAPLPEASRLYVERVRAASTHLLQLIEQILTFSRLEADRESVRLEPVRMDAVAREVVEMVQPLAVARGLEFHARIEPALVHADSGKLRQILLNLASNALKFTEEGRIELAVSSDGVHGVARVSDTGVGIAPEHLERIFEPFWQVEQGRTRGAGGTGLGLTVTRQLTTLMGGELDVESERGCGSAFTLKVPVCAEARSAEG